MKYCVDCGKQNIDEAKCCQNCGYIFVDKQCEDGESHRESKKKVFYWNKTIENVIVAVVSITALIFFGVCYGEYGLEYFFTSPVIWNDVDYIDIELISKTESSSRMELSFAITNNSFTDIDSYKFYLLFDGQVMELSDIWTGVDSFSTEIITEEFADSGSLKRVYNNLYGKSVDDIDFKFHTKELSSDSQVIVSNSGTIKIIVIIVIAIISAILISKDIVKIPWLRLILKFLMIPVIFIFIVFAVMAYMGSNNYKIKDNEMKQREYNQLERQSKHAASQKKYGDVIKYQQRMGELQRQIDENNKYINKNR